MSTAVLGTVGALEASVGVALGTGPEFLVIGVSL